MPLKILPIYVYRENKRVNFVCSSLDLHDYLYYNQCSSRAGSTVQAEYAHFWRGKLLKVV